MWLDIVLWVALGLLVISLIRTFIEKLKQGRVRRFKENYFSDLAGLGKKLASFQSSPSDKDEWVQNLRALSLMELDLVEQRMLAEFRDMFDDFLVFHKLKGLNGIELKDGVEHDDWREKAAKAAKQKMLVMIIWEAHSLLQDDVRSSEWVRRIESFIDVTRSSEEIIYFRQADPVLEEDLSGLLKEAADLMMGLKGDKKNDYRWLRQFKIVFPKLENALGR